ncbi:MAG: hypothetical protein H8D23_20305 [Candidatus Brocadiales bacterium]|nr:hypothetical protein [Candidatus Brocadiales bacterium]
MKTEVNEAIEAIVDGLAKVLKAAATDYINDTLPEDDCKDDCDKEGCCKDKSEESEKGQN